MGFGSIRTNLFNRVVRANLDKQTARLSSAFQQLTSGSRINNVTDDAAGLAQRTTLDRNQKLFSAGARNISNTLGELTVADQALASLDTITTRISELAGRAANTSVTQEQRQALDTEAQKLRDEYNRIVTTTDYSGKKLLTGQESSLNVQVGTQATDAFTVGIDGVNTSADALNSFTQVGSTSDFGTSGHRTYADINEDGVLDIVSAGPTEVGFYFGNADGTFASVASLSKGPSYANFGGAIGTTDFNNDGHLDVYTTTDGGTGYASVYLGNGNGTFGARIGTVYSGASKAQSSDVDHDGFEDLVLGNGTDVSVVFGNGNGTFKNQTLIFSTTEYGEYALADFNGDGHTDLFTTKDVLAGGGVDDSHVRVYYGNGNGTFKAEVTSDTTFTATDLELADFDYDGDLDVAIAGYFGSTVSIAINNGDGTFKDSTFLMSSGRAGISAGDLNNDGLLDIAGADLSGNYLEVVYGNGNGTFQAVASVGFGQEPLNPTLIDFNNDGFTDVGTFKAGNQVLRRDTSIGLGLSQFSLLTTTAAERTLVVADSAKRALTSYAGKVDGGIARLQAAGRYASNQSVNSGLASQRTTEADIATSLQNGTESQVRIDIGNQLLSQADDQLQVLLTIVEDGTKK